MNRLVILLVLISLTLCSPAFAKDESAPAKEKATPTKVVAKEEAAPKQSAQKQEIKNNKRSVYIEHEGADELGDRFALAVKEAFRKSEGFFVADSPEKSMVLTIATKVEFSDRPQLGSIASIIWRFAEKPNVFSYYLNNDLRCVDETILPKTAEAIVAKTDKIISKYFYLYE
ncbi:MAG: hypothetical protein ACNI27_07970 [Desulfovibrio sp.]